MYTPRAYALSSNKVPAIVAGLTLLGGYVVGPLVGHLLYRNAIRVGVAHADLPTEGDTP